MVHVSRRRHHEVPAIVAGLVQAAEIVDGQGGERVGGRTNRGRIAIRISISGIVYSLVELADELGIELISVKPPKIRRRFTQRF